MGWRETDRAVRIVAGGNVKTAIQAAVLYALARHASDKTATAWPSVATICAETLYSESGVRAALAGLVASGVLIRTERKAPNGRSTSACYRIAAGEIEAQVIGSEGPGGGPCADVTVQVVEGEGPGGGPYEGPGGGPSSLNRSDMNRPLEPSKCVCGPEVVDPARESTHTHKGEDLVGRFAKFLNKVKADPLPVLKPAVDSRDWGKPRPAPAPKGTVNADGWGFTPDQEHEAPKTAAVDDGWGCGYVDPEAEAPLIQQPAGAATTVPQLEEMILDRTRGRRLSMSPLSSSSLLALVERYGMARVVEETAGIIEPVDQPVMMLEARLKRVATERPRAPNGNRW